MRRRTTISLLRPRILIADPKSLGTVDLPPTRTDFHLVAERNPGVFEGDDTHREVAW